MATGTIFINYRRDDSRADAGRLYDRLEIRYPDRVFRDVSDLGPGVEWRDAIAKALGTADACIVVIGRNWLGATDSAGNRRLENPNDTVRLEILAALNNGVRLFPVLVGDAQMPTEEQLPLDLRPLARRNALEISEQDWDEDFNKLVRAIEASLGWIPTTPARPAESATPPTNTIAQVHVQRGIQPTAPVAPPAARRSAAGVLTAATVVLVIGSLGAAAFRFGYLSRSSRPRPQVNTVDGAKPTPSTRAESAPVSSPSATRNQVPVLPAEPTMSSPPVDRSPAPAPTGTERRVPAASPPVKPLPSGGALGNQANPQAAGRESAPLPASGTGQSPPSDVPFPRNPSVFHRCAGAAEVCAALRAALDQALERESLPGVRDPDRAEILIEANVSVVEDRVDRQFGTTFAVRTYSVDLAGEARRSRESVPMPAPRSFSFDARFGRDRLAENAHLIAESAVEKVRAFLKKR